MVQNTPQKTSRVVAGRYRLELGIFLAQFITVRSRNPDAETDDAGVPANPPVGTESGVSGTNDGKAD